MVDGPCRWRRCADRGCVGCCVYGRTRHTTWSVLLAKVGRSLLTKSDPLRSFSDSIPYPFAVHPATGSLVVPSSHSSTVQFIDLPTSTVLFELEVAPSNRVSRRDEKEHKPVAVERVVFSAAHDGVSRWMATLEGRAGDEVEGGGAVKTLKIWRWDVERRAFRSDRSMRLAHAEGRYVVITQIPRPHGPCDLSTVTFSPLARRGATSASPRLSTLLVTTAVDGTAKVWQVRQAKKGDDGELFPSCRSSSLSCLKMTTHHISKFCQLSQRAVESCSAILT